MSGLQAVQGDLVDLRSLLTLKQRRSIPCLRPSYGFRLLLLLRCCMIASYSASSFEVYPAPLHKYRAIAVSETAPPSSALTECVTNTPGSDFQCVQ